MASAWVSVSALVKQKYPITAAYTDFQPVVSGFRNVKCMLQCFQTMVIADRGGNVFAMDMYQGGIDKAEQAEPAMTVVARRLFFTRTELSKSQPGWIKTGEHKFKSISVLAMQTRSICSKN